MLKIGYPWIVVRICLSREFDFDVVRVIVIFPLYLKNESTHQRIVDHNTAKITYAA